MVPVAPSRVVWRVLRCPSKRGISSLFCSCAFSACWIREASTRYFLLMRCISRLFGCLSLGFVARIGWSAPSARLYR